MYELGDALVFALSALKSWNWNAFRNAFDGEAARRVAQSDIPEQLSNFARWRCATILDSLGHCDFVFNGGSRQLLSTPAILASLPVAGLPRAVMCGARSPETLPALLHRADGFRGSVRVTSASQDRIWYYAPRRIEVEADDASEMVRFAEGVGTRFARVPPAWQLALRAGDLAGYLSRIGWSDDPEISWLREDFDPSTGRFGPPRDAKERLSRYQNPIRGVWSYRLVRGGSSAPVDHSWGRWAVLSWASRRVLDFDSTTGLLKVPASIPLPRLIARALVLCTGRAPGLALAGAPDSPSELAKNDLTKRVETYGAVPAEVFELVAAKVGQSEPMHLKGKS